MHYWDEFKGQNPKQLSPLNLAFMGDAIFEVAIRERLLIKGNRPVSDLHKEAVHFVCAQAQALGYEAIQEIITEEELAILKRGRNCSSIRTPKSSSMMDYRRATAVEALVGYLYLAGRLDRLRLVIDTIYEAVESGANSVEES